MSAVGPGHDSAVTPEEWQAKSEQRYARTQQRLAEAYGVDVESRAVETGMGRVHYLVGGPADGDPVVLLHGINVSAATWIPMLGALTDEYRVYVPDRPGRGLSEPYSYDGGTLRRDLTRYLVDLFDELGLERPHVVASSLGGLQAFLLTVDHDRVDRLCLVGAPGGLSTEMGLLLRLSTLRGVNRLLTWLLDRGDPMESMRERMEQFNVTDTAAVTEPFYEILLAHRELPGRRASERSLTLAETSFGRVHDVFDIAADVAAIERPTCFVWGTEDAFWSPEVGRPVAERMPDARFHVLDDHGHMPWMEPDEQASGHVRAFLDGDE